MAYEWGTPGTPYFSNQSPSIQLTASKGNRTCTFSGAIQISGHDLNPTDQDAADFLGVLLQALTADGWSATVALLGEASRPLEEV